MAEQSTGEAALCSNSRVEAGVMPQPELVLSLVIRMTFLMMKINFVSI